MSAPLTRGGARIAGFATGLALVATVAWQAWRVPPTEAPLGLDVALSAVPSGEVAIERVRGDVLAASGLTPGEDSVKARGLLHVRNLTGRTMAARPRLEGGDPGLDRVLHLELTRRGVRVFLGPAGALRSGRADAALRMTAGELAGIRVRAFVPPTVPEAALGRAARFQISFKGEVAR
jgi:hypothetical protein